MIAFCYVTCHY